MFRMAQTSGKFGRGRSLSPALGGALVAVLLGLAAYLLIPEGQESRQARRALEFEDRLHEGRRHGGTGAAAEVLSPAEALKRASADARGEVLTPRVLLEEYRLHFRYPSSSRPLSRRMVDLLDPYAVRPERLPLFEKQTHARGDRPIYLYSWTAPTYLVTGARAAVAALEVYEPSSDRPVSIQVQSASVQADPEFGSVEIGTAAVAADSAGRNVFRWQPDPKQRLHWGQVAFLVRFRAPNGKLFLVQTDFRSTPRPPAYFSGRFREQLRNGSLAIEAEMDVKTAGRYIIEANLFDEDGQPMQWVYLRRYLERGRQQIELPFFGLVFHDRGFGAGRLVLRNLRAFRLHYPFDPRKLDGMLARSEPVPTTNAPDREYVEPYSGEYRTKKVYKISEFSRAEYQGKDKAARLSAIRQYARAWEQEHGPSPETKID